MLHCVPPDEEAHPVQIGLLRAKAIVKIAHALAHLVQQLEPIKAQEEEKWTGSFEMP
jgi:hypothetical protein